MGYVKSPDCGRLSRLFAYSVDARSRHGALPPAQAELPAAARRLVSRGRGAASDFGALEVLAGASIAHTDPFRVAAALDAQLAAQDIDSESDPACVDGW